MNRLLNLNILKVLHRRTNRIQHYLIFHQVPYLLVQVVRYQGYFHHNPKGVTNRQKEEISSF